MTDRSAKAAYAIALPQRPWRWAVVVIFTQMPIMIVGGSGCGLLPLGLVLLAILSLPAVAAASLAGRMGSRRANT